LGEHPEWDKLIAEGLKALTADDQKGITQEGYDWAYALHQERGLFIEPYIFATGKDIKGYSKLPLFDQSEIAYDYGFEYLEKASQ
jgi:hypothetical protein